MASVGDEEVTGQEKMGGRRTRSSRKASQTIPTAASPARSTRRSSRKQLQEQMKTGREHETIIYEEEVHQEKGKVEESVVAEEDNVSYTHQSDIIKEMLAEAAQGVIMDENVETVVMDGSSEAIYVDSDGAEHHEIIEYDEEIGIGEQTIEETQVDMTIEQDDCIIYSATELNDDDHFEELQEEVISRPQNEGNEQQQAIVDDDIEMFVIQDDNEQEQNNVTVHLDEKSSSFPFGNVVQSENSEDGQKDEDEEATEETHEHCGESSLLASLAGDNANSLPSVGGGEENESKKNDFDEKTQIRVTANPITSIPEKMDSDESFSNPAIAEDIGNHNDSNATNANTELVSEDELPTTAKPEVNDAEEVSDEELPAPKRAELPADAEVISEDELPSGAAISSANKKITISISVKSSLNFESNKRKVANEDTSKPEISQEAKAVEEYNPSSPTSESNDEPPVEKKAKIDTNIDDKDAEIRPVDIKTKKKEKEREKSKEKEKEKDKDKEKEKEKDKNKEKEKERKKLPDLDKYWRTVKDDPADFTGWTYLLQYVDQETDAEAAREAYDAFLSHYPYCYGYWRKYADYEKRKGIKTKCNEVFERGLEAIPLSVDLWIHYITHVKSTHGDNEEYIRSQFERALSACGLEFRSDKLWDAYIKWENEGKRYQHIVKIYDRLLAIPTQGYSGHFDNFQDLINTHPITSTISSEELEKLRIEVRESLKTKQPKEGSKDKEGTSVSTSGSGDEKSPSKTKEIKSDEVLAATPTSDSVTADGDDHTCTEEELSAIKDKVISIRRKIHKATVAAVTARWTFEEGIKRPYFHVKPLERCQLKNWKDYLDFEVEKGDRKRILILFERCLIACALYDEFWLKLIRYLETQTDQADIIPITRDAYRRACTIHHPDKPSLHLMWSAFEECQNNFDKAAEILVNLEKKCANLLQISYRRINVERRRGDLNKCKELYEFYIKAAKNKNIAGSLSIKYARFCNKICNDLEGGFKVLQQALEKDPANTRVALQMIDLALQRQNVDEQEIVQIMDKFMTRENIDPEQRVLFAQRKVEFLEDFGTTAKGLQDAQRALQSALSKANEAKKKSENSPAKKTSSSTTKDSSNSVSGSSAASLSASYNNGSSASTVANANYGYGTAGANSAYYSQQNSGSQQAYNTQQYDGYYNHWQYGSSGYSGYGQWSGYGNYY